MNACRAVWVCISLPVLAFASSIGSNETLSIVQTRSMEVFTLRDVSQLFDNCRVEMTLTSEDTLQECALAMRLANPPQVTADGTILADGIDYASWEQRRSTHSLSFPKSLSVPVFLAVILFSPSAFPLRYELRLLSSPLPLCPADCSSAGKCEGTVCSCREGRYEKDCSFAPVLYREGQAIDVWLRKNARSDGVFLTNGRSVDVRVRWTDGQLDILAKHRDFSSNSSDIPSYSSSDIAKTGLNSSWHYSFPSVPSGHWFISLLNHGKEVIRAEITIGFDESNVQSSRIVIIICCAIGATLIILWGVYIYCKVKGEMHIRTLQMEVIPMALRPVSPAFAGMFPEERFGVLREVVNQNCAVCLDSYSQSDHVRLLLCGHVFHSICIDKWMLTQPFCCICKKDYSDLDCLAEEVLRFRQTQKALRQKDPPAPQTTEETEFTFTKGDDCEVTDR